MNARGWIASALFTTLCLGGIFTLFSQAPSRESMSLRTPGDFSTMLNPADEAGRDLGESVPMALERGAALTLSATREEKEKPRPTLRLR